MLTSDPYRSWASAMGALADAALLQPHSRRLRVSVQEKTHTSLNRVFVCRFLFFYSRVVRPSHPRSWRYGRRSGTGRGPLGPMSRSDGLADRKLVRTSPIELSRIVRASLGCGCDRVPGGHSPMERRSSLLPLKALGVSETGVPSHKRMRSTGSKTKPSNR